jgi:hypothetical protein
MTGSPSVGATAVWEWSGRVFAQVPGQAAVVLAAIQGTEAIASRSFESDAKRSAMVSRKALLVIDLDSIEPTTMVEVPWSNDLASVQHQWLEPVIEDVDEMLDDLVGDLPDAALVSERFWIEPFPLSPRRWPDGASGPSLDVCEFRQVRPNEATVTRIEPWWPTMRCGARPGRMVTHLRGVRRASWQEVDPALRGWIEADHPEFAHAPRDLSGRAMNHLWDTLR